MYSLTPTVLSNNRRWDVARVMLVTPMNYRHYLA